MQDEQAIILNENWQGIDERFKEFDSDRLMSDELTTINRRHYPLYILDAGWQFPRERNEDSVRLSELLVEYAPIVRIEEGGKIAICSVLDV